LRIVGGGFLACGVALAALSVGIAKGQRWASWASLMTGCAVWVPTLLVTLMLKSAAPNSQPPIISSAGILALVILSFALSFLSQQQTREA